MMLNINISRLKDIWSRFSGKGIYPHELAFLLDNPIRKFILTPQKLADYLHLNDNSKVLEIGSGPGYFSLEVSRRLKNGYLVLYDIQHEMLLKCKKKLSENKIQNVFLIQGDAINLPLKSDSFDVVFLVTVLGEVPDPKKCLLAIHKSLRNGGTLSITEMKGDPDLITADELRKMAAHCGFEYFEDYDTKKGFTINYKKS